MRAVMRETWCAARQAFVANPGANESSLPPAMADSLYPPRCANCQWSLAAHGAACLCASASNSSACWRKCCEPPTASVRESSLAVVLQTHGTVTQGLLARIPVARAFELGAKWEATPAAERGVGQFIHRLRRDAA